EAPPIRFRLRTDSTRCTDSRDGRATLDTLYGGFPPLHVSWSNGQNGLLSEHLAIGTYTFEIVDAVGCSVIDTFRIPGPPPLELNETRLTHVSCFNGSDGAIQLSAQGGTGSLTYSWATGDSTSLLSGLMAGFYQLRISDRYNCTLSPPPFRILQPDSLHISFNAIEEVRCFGEANGSATAVVRGGTPPYRYAWSQGTNQPLATELAAGNYAVLVSDSQNCQTEAVVEISQPLPLHAEVRTEGPTCTGSSGRLFFEDIRGGTPPFRFEANGGQYTNNLAFLEVEPDTYLASLIDINGCRFDSVVLVPEPLPLEVLLVQDEFVINYGDSVRLEAIALNVRGDTLLSWTPGAALSCSDWLTPTARPQRSTRYQIEVRDTFNCSDAATAQIIVEYPERLFLPNAFSPNGDGQNDRLFPFGAYEVTLIESFQIFNRWGSLVFEQQDFLPNDPTAGWDGTYQGQALPAAVYVYRLRVRYAYGQVEKYTGEVVLLR
ncbi:MAG: hypothetical protein D6772_14520, partial [Bacteroidetes bacterium]